MPLRDVSPKVDLQKTPVLPDAGLFKEFMKRCPQSRSSRRSFDAQQTTDSFQGTKDLVPCAEAWIATLNMCESMGYFSETLHRNE